MIGFRTLLRLPIERTLDDYRICARKYVDVSIDSLFVWLRKFPNGTRAARKATYPLQDDNQHWSLTHSSSTQSWAMASTLATSAPQSSEYCSFWLFFQGESGTTGWALHPHSLYRILSPLRSIATHLDGAPQLHCRCFAMTEWIAVSLDGNTVMAATNTAEVWIQQVSSVWNESILAYLPLSDVIKSGTNWFSTQPLFQSLLSRIFEWREWQRCR